MAVTLNPYLSFLNTARDAMEFYRSIFGGDLQIMTFADMPGMPVDETDRPKVMHAQLTGDNGIVLMGADTPHTMSFTPPAGVSISLSGDDEKTLRGYWDKLSEGATIGEPLKEAPWGDSFGMLTDRYGIPWLINIAAPVV